MVRACTPKWRFGTQACVLAIRAWGINKKFQARGIGRLRVCYQMERRGDLCGKRVLLHWQ